MNLIERYVHEVGRRLPRKERADIEAELLSTLVDTLESRVEGEPNEQDQIALLREFGSPEEVAASYRGGDQYLIGPDLFPLFRMVTGIVLLVLTVVQLVLLGFHMVFTPGYYPDLEWTLDFGGSLVMAIGFIVVTFGILQYFGVQPDLEEEPWDPRDLPEPAGEEPVSTTGLLVEMTFTLALIAVLIFLPDILALISTTGATVVNNPVLQEYLGWIVAPLLLGIGLDIILLWRGEWTTATRLLKIGVNIFSIGVLYLLIDAHTAWLAANGAAGWFTVFEQLPETGDFPASTTQVLVMWAFRLAFTIAFVVMIVETVGLVYNAARNALTPATQMPSGEISG